MATISTNNRIASLVIFRACMLDPGHRGRRGRRRVLAAINLMR